MTNLSSFSLLKSKVDKIHAEESTESVGQAFMRLGLASILRLNEEEIEEALTDGPHDGEIDAIHIENNIIHIFTFKYTDDFKNTDKNYPGSELDQFILTLDLIISGYLIEKTINEAVWEKYKSIGNLSNSTKIEFKIHIVSNKLEPNESSKIKLENTINKYRTVEKPIYYDQEKIVSIILEEKINKIDGKISFIDKQHFEKSNGGIKTIIGATTAMDLINLIKDPFNDSLIRDDIFNENVRVYKANHRVNLAIIESAQSSTNHEFFYLNNGITILCEEVDYPVNQRNPLTHIKNLQIINGGQTSHSLFQVYKLFPEKLESVEILIRICEVKKSNPISGKISETTNSQIPVGNRDLRSNDTIQRKLKAEFEAKGYFYESKPNEYIDKPSNQVLNNELLGQLYMSYSLELPSEAKNNKALVFGDKYDKIFNENNITASELLRIYSLYIPLLQKKKNIQSQKRKGEVVDENVEFISWSTFHLLLGMKYLFENEIKKIYADALLTNKNKSLQVNKLFVDRKEEFVNLSIEEMNKIIASQKQNYKGIYSHDKFFKESATNSIIRTHFENYHKA